MAAIKAVLEARGADCVMVPEAPTLLMSQGFSYPGIDGGDLLFAFELALFRTQLHLESTAESLARVRQASAGGAAKPCVILLDRALLDMSAYMPAEMWPRVRAACGLASDAEVAARYDRVIHLVTAADGAIAAYTCENNFARSETPEEARANDRGVQAAWSGHPSWHRVGNDAPSFAEKIKAATRLAVGALEEAEAEADATGGSRRE